MQLRWMDVRMKIDSIKPVPSGAVWLGKKRTCMTRRQSSGSVTDGGLDR